MKYRRSTRGTKEYSKEPKDKIIQGRVGINKKYEN